MSTVVQGGFLPMSRIICHCLCSAFAPADHKAMTTKLNSSYAILLERIYWPMGQFRDNSEAFVPIAPVKRHDRELAFVVQNRQFPRQLLRLVGWTLSSDRVFRAILFALTSRRYSRWGWGRQCPERRNRCWRLDPSRCHCPQ
jgi:hypothetical protein